MDRHSGWNRFPLSYFCCYYYYHSRRLFPLFPLMTFPRSHNHFLRLFNSFFLFIYYHRDYFLTLPACTLFSYFFSSLFMPLFPRRSANLSKPACVVLAFSAWVFFIAILFLAAGFYPTGCQVFSFKDPPLLLFFLFDVISIHPLTLPFGSFFHARFANCLISISPNWEKLPYSVYIFYISFLPFFRRHSQRFYFFKTSWKIGFVKRYFPKYRKFLI